MLANLEGTRLDTYQLIRRLGGGNFGDVYLSEDLHNNTQVAIKVLEPIKTQEANQLFLREVRSLVRLKHPHIVPVRDFGVDEKTGIPFIVMEYAPNGSLRQCHPRGTLVPLETVVTYVTQIADALQYAHDDKLIHRDVKPGNVLIGVNNQLLLSDFGIVTFTHTLYIAMTQQPRRDVIGSRLYMAPEQWQGNPEKASDQYSLAIMTYEWLTGTCPFTGRTPAEVRDQHINVAPRPLHELVPDIPSQIEAVVMKALAKAPTDRYASIKEYATALTKAFQQQQKTSEQWFTEGNAHDEAKHYEEAITCYTRSIQLNPNYAAAYNNRGNIYSGLKQYEQAIADCSRAIELDPDFARAYNNRGAAYYNLKQFEQAIADLTRRIELNPNNAVAYGNRGFVYEQAKQYWQALQDYVRALELDPKNETATPGKERVKKLLNL